MKNHNQTPNLLLILVAFLTLTHCSNDDDNTDATQDLYISIPDFSFETILIHQGIDSDGIINQQILKTDAEDVAILDLSILSDGLINDITGIQGFVNLTKLIATQHDIVEIDLRSNTKLDTLYLGGNYISNIDVSHNTNLILLDLQSNQLTSINGLSEAINLKNLDLSWNYLESFSIHNESLEVLHLRNNDLASININGAINLKNILLTTNHLTSIDLSTNTLLKTLVIPDNKIEAINLDRNINLTHLSIFSNLLTTLDVSNNHELVHMQVDRNPDLSCIKIKNAQIIPFVTTSEYQVLNSECD